MNKLVCVVLMSLCVAVVVNGKNVKNRATLKAEVDEIMDYLESLDEMPRCGGGKGGEDQAAKLAKYYATIRYALMELKGMGTTTTEQTTIGEGKDLYESLY